MSSLFLSLSLPLLQSGDVHLYEISSGVLLETFQAHSRPVWAVGVSPGRRGFATGSADHDVKFWEFELISDEDRPGRYGISKIDNIINNST